MIFVALIIGAVLVIAALRDTYPQLFAALGQDTPAFVVWAAAIVALGVVGFLPGLKPVAKMLLGLVVLVIVLTNYQKILQGFANVAKPPAAAKTKAVPASASGSLQAILTSALNGSGGTLAAFNSSAMGEGP